MSPEITYYIVGFFSGVLCLAGYLLSGEKNKLADLMPPKKKSWTKLQNIEFTFDSEYEFKSEMTLQEAAYMVAEVMKIHIEKRPGSFANVTILPGQYSVDFLLKARFVKRD